MIWLHRRPGAETSSDCATLTQRDRASVPGISSGGGQAEPRKEA